MENQVGGTRIGLREDTQENKFFLVVEPQRKKIISSPKKKNGRQKTKQI